MTFSVSLEKHDWYQGKCSISDGDDYSDCALTFQYSQASEYHMLVTKTQVM